MLNLLHVSDLHFGDDHRWGKEEVPKLEEAITKALEKYPENWPHLLILSGDTTTKGTGDDFGPALTFFNTLIMRKPFERVVDVLIVPGNHDFRWYDRDGKKIITDADKRKEQFCTFRKSITDSIKAKLKTERSSDISSITYTLRNQLEEHLIDWAFIPQGEDEHSNFLFLALNSMKIDSYDDRGIGYFKKEQLETLEDLVTFYRRAFHDHELVVIAICHHHLIPIAYLEREYFKNKEGNMVKRCSVTLDARAALDTLQKIGCRVVLHGHQHQPACILWRDRIGKENRAINIVCAGSVGASRNLLGDISLNHFFVHKITRSSLEVQSYLSSLEDNSIFIPDTKYSTSFIWPPLESPDEDCALAYIEPRNAKRVTCASGVDGSNLFFLFMNVKDCKKSRKLAYDLSESWENIEICAMYDLYGRYDSLVRYREKVGGEGSKFCHALIKHLQSGPIDQLRKGSATHHYHFIDATRESYNLNDFKGKPEASRTRLLIPDDQIYENSQRSCAFLEILFRGNMSPDEFVNDLLMEIELAEGSQRGSISNIIKGVHSSREESLILELQMSCNQFHCLNRLSILIEKIIDPKDIDKRTHIAYSHQELDK